MAETNDEATTAAESAAAKKAAPKKAATRKPAPKKAPAAKSASAESTAAAVTAAPKSARKAVSAGEPTGLSQAEPAAAAPPPPPAPPAPPAPPRPPYQPVAGQYVLEAAVSPGSYLKRFGARAWGLALGSSLVVYFSAWVLAAISILVAWLAVGNGQNALWLLLAPFQFLGMALFGKATLTGAAALFPANSTVQLLPLLFTVLLVLALIFAGSRAERALPTATLPRRLVLSLVSGLLLALLALSGAYFFPIPLVVGFFDASPVVTAASPALFFGALIVGTLASLAGRQLRHRKQQAAGTVSPGLARYRSAFAAAASYLGVLVAVGLLFVIISVWTASGFLPALASHQLWGNGAALFAAVASFSSVLVPGDFSLPAMGIPSQISLFDGSTGAWSLLVLLLTVVAIFIAAIVLRLSRPSTADADGWSATILSFAAAGFALQLFSGLIVETGAGTAWTGPAPWTFIAFAVVGALVEATARYLVPGLLWKLGQERSNRMAGSLFAKVQRSQQVSTE